MKRGAAIIGCVLALFFLGPATAQDDLASKIINDPGNPQVTGASAKLREDPAVQGGQALRIAVRRKGANPWDVAVQTTIDKPVKAGDSLIFAFWARLEKGENGATETVLPYNAVQISAAPYTALFVEPATIGPEWKMFEVKGKAAKDQAAGSLNATIHLATAAQTVDLGPLIVVNMGQ
ncbi:hypothetical protein [Altererythrobacter sp. Root672]|uniref:hypothetical protein n=1 Tax=Altererythrobacter sp. Root672 TaxID=1736584 RepID=UPI0006F245CB|nr:hypothetical protein [Altererythrobacter sp. Root672]KRA81198.1 hypothetical protein ASD76_11470 [Altererythrobacter sp. Root672]